MKIMLLMAIVATLAVLFACLLPLLLQHGSRKTITARSKRYRVRFLPLNAIERVFSSPLHLLQGLSQRVFGPSRLVASNIAEGTHSGNLTKLTDAAIATRFLLVKKGSDTAHIAVCSAITDRPIGVCTDEAAAAEEPVNVALLGSSKSTLKVVASGAIASGTRVAVTAAGKVQTAVATQYPIGIALTDAGADGDILEIDPINPAAVI
jgi:hypothetical protein